MPPPSAAANGSAWPLLPITPLIHPIRFAVHPAVTADLVEDVAEFLSLDGANEPLVQFVVPLHAPAEDGGRVLDGPTSAEGNEGIHCLRQVKPTCLPLLRRHRPIGEERRLLVGQTLPVLDKG